MTVVGKGRRHAAYMNRVRLSGGQRRGSDVDDPHEVLGDHEEAVIRLR